MTQKVILMGPFQLIFYDFEVYLQNKLYTHPNAMGKHSALVLKWVENLSSPYPCYLGQYQKIPSKYPFCKTAVLNQLSTDLFILHCPTEAKWSLRTIKSRAVCLKL